MDDLLNEFLTETAESIEVVDQQMVTLEQDPNNKSILDNIFRLVHTIKGTCGFLGLPRLEAVAHASENVLGKFRDGEIKVTPDAVTLILESLDRIKEILAGLEATEAEPAGDDTAVIASLNAFAAGETAPPVAKKPAAKLAAVKTPAPAAPVDEMSLPEPLSSDGTRPGEVSLEELEAAFLAAPGPDDEDPVVEVEEVAEVAEAPEEITLAEAAAAVAASDNGSKTKAPAESTIGNQTIRVNVDLLEGLMNMVSELVLTRNQLLQMLRNNSDSEFASPLQRLSQCTTELQEGVMKTRMQPIGNAWAKLPRIVRDLCVDLKKKIDLQMLGADTELDRQVLELIKDPLTHMVRNSADHGVEMPKDRLKAGKPETGTIRLNAFHEGGHIIIEIADDGHGLPIEKLKAKALKNGLASAAELAEMPDQQIQKFIFNPGFSTAEKVTSVSGRGVGMDVVRSNIEKIGGTIDLKSTEGRGTTFLIKIPLTLAIVSALVVKSGAERFAIPQICVLELVRAANNSEHKIEHINQTPVLRLRDRLLPLISLNKMLGLLPVESESKSDSEGESAGEETVAAKSDEDFIVVTQVGSFTFGIVVDQVFDTEEIVVKPVAPLLRDIPIYSGNTILGDGSVIMILDPNGIASQTGNVLDEVDHATAKVAQAMDDDNATETMLVFKAGAGAPKAVPLSLIARLEEVDIAAIESSEGGNVVQYRGQLMPLILADGVDQIRESGRQPVLVFTEGSRSFGVAVDQVIDIVEERLAIELKSDRSGVIGTAVIAEKASEVIDVSYYFGRAFSDWHLGSGDSSLSDKSEKRILMIDDSVFFQNMVKPLLISAGYKVTAVASAEDALSLRDSGKTFDIILSDIEMPGMDGYDFAEAIREQGPWQEVPMIAMSSHVSQKHFERGREVGFSDYIKKFDRAALLAKLTEQLSSEGQAA